MLGAKELYIIEHERLTDALMEESGCDWGDAYDATAGAAYDAMRDRLADLADRACMQDGMS